MSKRDILKMSDNRNIYDMARARRFNPATANNIITTQKTILDSQSKSITLQFSSVDDSKMYIAQRYESEFRKETVDVDVDSVKFVEGAIDSEKSFYGIA